MSTLRQMAEARGLAVEELMRRLELTECNTPSSAPLRPRVEELFTMALEGSAPARPVPRCQCEHVSHLEGPLAGHPYGEWPAGARLALFVGPICDECATTHLATYLVDAQGRVLPA